MSNISASQVKELREKTGLGLMDCKKALQEANGDLDLAIEELRKTSGLKASKKSSRSAADGLIGIKSVDGKSFMVEINCETDFVARDDSFNLFMKEVLEIVSTNGDKSLEELLKLVIEEMINQWKKNNLSVDQNYIKNWWDKINEWKNHFYCFYPAMMHSLIHSEEAKINKESFLPDQY